MTNEQCEYIRAFLDNLGACTQSIKPLQAYDFAKHLERRFEAGVRDYGERSYQRPITEILDEVAQELVDVAGWMFFADRQAMHPQAMELCIGAFEMWQLVQKFKERAREQA